MPRPQLPNAPLGEVVCELRFPGDLGLYSSWGAIQGALRDEFPKLLVPKVDAGEYPALKPFHLANDDQSEQVTLALNSLAFITRRYPEYDGFRRRYGQVLQRCLSKWSPPHLTRLGLRYLNWIPAGLPGITRKPGQLHGCLKLELMGLPEGLEWLSAPMVLAQFASRGSKLNLQLGPDEKGLRLDLDAYQEGELPIADTMKIMDGMHELIEQAFFAVVTPDYLAYMRGEMP